MLGQIQRIEKKITSPQKPRIYFCSEHCLTRKFYCEMFFGDFFSVFVCSRFGTNIPVLGQLSHISRI